MKLKLQNNWNFFFLKNDNVKENPKWVSYN